MSIQIDDSGWGCLLGGVMIGMYNTANKRFKAKLIPISYFKGNKFKNGSYRSKAVALFLSEWPKLGNTESFQICRGTILDGIADFLTSHGWLRKVERLEIQDPLQNMLEHEFAKHLMKCGVPEGSGGAHCLSFDDQVKWVLEDAKRVKYVKTGWNSWQNKYSKLLKDKD
jgi:hypothetical protein